MLFWMEFDKYQMVPSTCLSFSEDPWVPHHQASIFPYKFKHFLSSPQHQIVHEVTDRKWDEIKRRMVNLVRKAYSAFASFFLGNFFLHLLQPIVALKLKKPHSLRDAGMSQVTQSTARWQNLGLVLGQSSQIPSLKSNNSSVRGPKEELTSCTSSWGPEMIPPTAIFSSLFLSSGGKFRKLR